MVQLDHQPMANSANCHHGTTWPSAYGQHCKLSPWYNLTISLWPTLQTVTMIQLDHQPMANTANCHHDTTWPSAYGQHYKLSPWYNLTISLWPTLQTVTMIQLNHQPMANTANCHHDTNWPSAYSQHCKLSPWYNLTISLWPTLQSVTMVQLDCPLQSAVCASYVQHFRGFHSGPQVLIFLIHVRINDVSSQQEFLPFPLKLWKSVTIHETHN